jgi:hypothetical protein
LLLIGLTVSHDYRSSKNDQHEDHNRNDQAHGDKNDKPVNSFQPRVCCSVHFMPEIAL